MAKVRRKKPKERVARKNPLDSLKEVINRARNLIPFKEKISSASVAIGVAVLGVIIAILITPLISPLIAATIYPAVDAESPQISDLFPEDNIYTYNVSSISATIVDYGGSGIDQEKSDVKLSSSTSPDIEGSCSFNEDTIIFTPSAELSPDMYTATFIIYDNAKRVQEKSTRFVVLENPNLDTEIYETTDIFEEGISIYGVVWKNTYLAFNFQVRNDCSSTSCENIGLDLVFPGNVLSTIVRSSRGCQNPTIDDSFSNVMFIADNKTIDNIQGESVTIEIDKMYPQGFFSATVLVDPYYEIDDEGVILFTDNTGSYYGEYLHSQYGKTYKGDITGLINASPEFYFKKGQYLKKMSIENMDYERLLYSLVFFDKALELGLNNSDIWVEKGECFMFFSGFPDSLYYFNLANEITPNERAFYDIGLLFYKVGNFEGCSIFL